MEAEVPTAGIEACGTDGCRSEKDETGLVLPSLLDLGAKCKAEGRREGSLWLRPCGTAPSTVVLDERIFWTEHLVSIMHTCQTYPVDVG